MSLSRSPKTGAELMDEMERMSRGWWRPSPGSIYPLLEELSKEGLVRRRADGRYELVGPMRDHHGWTFPAPGVRTAQEAVEELRSVTAFLEDLGRSEGQSLASVRAQLKDVLQRLETLAGGPSA